MWIISTLFNFLLPKNCFICKNSGEVLCISCIRTCKKNIKSLPPHIYACYSFQDNHIRSILLSAKYNNKKDLLFALTESVKREFSNFIFGKEISKLLIIPVPMPMARKLVRGHNQTELIAKVLSESSDIICYTDVLERVQKEPQARQKTKKERLRNILGAFYIKEKNKTKIEGYDVILVDDITTTGATIEEAREVLLGAGAASVRAFCLAH